MAKVEIVKEYDGNIVSCERPDGRLYERPMGWRWLVVVDGAVVADFDLKREAVASAKTLKEANG